MKHKKLWQLTSPVIVLAVIGLVFCFATLITKQFWLFYIELAIFLAGLGFVFVKASNLQKNIVQYMNFISTKLDPKNAHSIDELPIPVILTTQNGEIIHHNTLFANDILAGESAYGVNISKIFEGFEPQVLVGKTATQIEFNDKKYSVFVSECSNKNRKFCASYFIEDTELKNKAMEYELSRPSVLIFTLDNYDEIMQNSKDSAKTQVISSIGAILEDYVAEHKGMMVRLSRDRYFVIIEERFMQKIISEKFAILDKVRAVVTEDKMVPTLSIGVGRGAKTITEAEKMARQALDMALGRGGDQAAVKTQGGYEFYGGISMGVEKKTKVKTRIIASAMLELIDNASNIMIMGHRFADLDAIGAAVGLYKAMKSLGKETNIVMDLDKNLVGALVERLYETAGYDGVFIEPDTALHRIDKNTLLFVVDTHSPTFVESEEVYRACKNVIVIDHHRKTVGHIDNAVIFFHEPFASSTSEMVAELVQYLCEDNVLTRSEAEALLAGIMLDTKNFILKTGVRTFEAAAYLRKMGADTVEVKKLFANSIESYQHKATIVTSAEVYRRCAIASTDLDTDDLRIVAPQAADELLSISDVDASFVYYRASNNTINISARSMGKMNVQVIMEKLGGGGHLTMAGAALSCTMEEAKQQIKNAVDEYISEKNV